MKKKLDLPKYCSSVKSDSDFPGELLSGDVSEDSVISMDDFARLTHGTFSKGVGLPNQGIPPELWSKINQTNYEAG